MKEHNFDKLFREKLTAYTQTAPPASMEILNKKLKQRRQKAWIKFARLAAALALIAISIYLVSLWTNPQKENLSSPIAGNQQVVLEEQTNPESIVTEKIEVPVSENNQQAKALPEIKEQPDSKPKSDQSNQVTLQVTKVDDPQGITLAADITPGEEEKSLISEEQQNAAPLADAESEPTKPKRGKVTITYKRSPAQEEPQLAMQQQSERKYKGLKKFFKKAQMVDYQSFSLAGIRATKDQLLAINKKEKSKETKPN